jgi:non-specific serine/threonine protein kinase
MSDGVLPWLLRLIGSSSRNCRGNVDGGWNEGATWDLRSKFDEVVWVGLGDIRDADQEADTQRRVVVAVAERLGVDHRAENLMEALVHDARRREILLVLDNCEHVVDAARWIAGELLSSWPKITILATSQYWLRLSGEVVRLVMPFKVPEDETSAAADNEAVTLLVEHDLLGLPV